jgi:hypothetical protein
VQALSRDGPQTVGRKTHPRNHWASAEQCVQPPGSSGNRGGAHNPCFQQVQDEMSKARSVKKDWEFVSKGTEISLGKLVPQYFTPPTLNLQTGVISTEDTDEIWEAEKEETIEKVRRRVNRSARADSSLADEAEVEKSFWLSRRPDYWVINRKMEKIILLEFKRTSDAAESYFQDTWKVAEKQHTPHTGLLVVYYS